MGLDPVSFFVEAQIFSLLATVGVPTAAAFALEGPLAYGALLGGLLGLEILTAPSAPAAFDPGGAKSVFKPEAAPPRLHIYGYAILGGYMPFENSTGPDKYQLIMHCDGPIDLIETYYIGGREVILDADGDVVSPPWTDDDGTYCNIESDLGDHDKAAWDDLITAFPSLFTSNHRGRGMAQSKPRFINPGLTSAKFSQLYQSGTQAVTVLARGPAIYDPRTDSTAWSDNGVLVARDFLATWWGFDTSVLDDDFIGSEADRADASITRHDTTTVPRARCWGVWTEDKTKGDTLQSLLDSIGARIVSRDSGNKYGVWLMDDDPAAEATVESGDILDITWHKGPQSAERPNLCNVWYNSPEQGYQLAQIDMTGIGWARIASEITANGEKPFDVKLPFCPDSSQAQRIARLKFALARADFGVMHVQYSGAPKIAGTTIVNVPFSGALGTRKVLITQPKWQDHQHPPRCEVEFALWPELSTYDPATDEAAAPEVIPDIAFGTPLTRPDAPDAVTEVSQPGPATVTRVHFDVPDDVAGPSTSFGLGPVEACYRTYDAADLPTLWRPMTVHSITDGADAFWWAEVGLDLRGVKCDFRIRTFDGTDSSRFSLIFQETVAQDNTAPGEPTLDGSFDGTDTVNLSAVAPADLDVAYLEIKREGVLLSTTACKPGDTVLASSSEAPETSDHNVTYTAQAFSSDGTGGTAVGTTVTIPGTGA